MTKTSTKTRHLSTLFFSLTNCFIFQVIKKSQEARFLLLRITYHNTTMSSVTSLNDATFYDYIIEGSSSRLPYMVSCLIENSKPINPKLTTKQLLMQHHKSGSALFSINPIYLLNYMFQIIRLVEECWTCRAIKDPKLSRVLNYFRHKYN